MVISDLIKKTTKVFNSYVRNRDKDKPCISCGRWTTLQAGHFYSAGHYSALRFEEDNVHGQCKQCNYFLSGNLNNYRINLEKRIGKDKLEKLDMKAQISKRNRSFKWDRFSLEEKIKYYKNK
mgnify:CR=1 FL=1